MYLLGEYNEFNLRAENLLLLVYVGTHVTVCVGGTEYLVLVLLFIYTYSFYGRRN